ncbi:hypothetical protein STANM309S_04543 [Streptomyces tanashiensis]
MVGDARVDVHPAVVGAGADVVVHVGGLRVLAEDVVVVRGAGGLHGPQRSPLVDGGAEQPGPDEPVGLLRALPQGVLLHERAEDVRHVLVERPRLAVVGEVRRVLGEAVGQLVADDVDREREVEEELAVAVAEHHLLAVPEGVVVLLVVVDGGAERQPGAVDRVVAEGVQEEVVGGAEAGRRRGWPCRRWSPARPRRAPGGRAAGCRSWRRGSCAGAFRRRPPPGRARAARSGWCAGSGPPRGCGGRPRRRPDRRTRPAAPGGGAGRSSRRQACGRSCQQCGTAYRRCHGLRR